MNFYWRHTREQMVVVGVKPPVKVGKKKLKDMLWSAYADG